MAQRRRFTEAGRVQPTRTTLDCIAIFDQQAAIAADLPR
jgi:hypothetical protein